MPPKHTGQKSPRRELRTFTAPVPIEVRTLADGSKQLKGYAIVWNSRSLDLGGFTEMCSPNMLKRTLHDNPDVLALRDHKQELLLGRTTAGTLALNVDSTGLAFIISLPRTAIGEDTAENVRLGNLSGCSFGFATLEDSWTVDNAGNVTRTLLDVDLFEISVTSFPAYQATSVSTRSAPADIRIKLTRDADNEDDDDCDPDLDDDCEDEDRCSCRCARCQRDACSECINAESDDENCAACPHQEEERMADGLRVRLLINRRLAVNHAAITRS